MAITRCAATAWRWAWNRPGVVELAFLLGLLGLPLIAMWATP